MDSEVFFTTNEILLLNGRVVLAKLRDLLPMMLAKASTYTDAVVFFAKLHFIT